MELSRFSRLGNCHRRIRREEDSDTSIEELKSPDLLGLNQLASDYT
jgi:hypothetical protein